MTPREFTTAPVDPDRNMGQLGFDPSTIISLVTGAVSNVQARKAQEAAARAALAKVTEERKAAEVKLAAATGSKRTTIMGVAVGGGLAVLALLGFLMMRKKKR